MKKMPEWLMSLLKAGGLTGIFLLLGNAMGWVRFSHKDKANVKKINAEAEVDIAEATNKKIDDEVKISKAALEWTVQLAGQLEKANIVGDKRQAEIDRLQAVMLQMRLDFDKRMRELEEILDLNQAELDRERQKNGDLLIQLKNFINKDGA